MLIKFFRWMFPDKGLNLPQRVHDGLKKAAPTRCLNEADRKGLDLNPKASGYINPYIKIGFEYKDREITSMPLCLLAHAYLKDYGFEPDKKIDGLKVVLTLAPGSHIKLPFYLQKRVGMTDMLTVEEACMMGLIDKAK